MKSLKITDVRSRSGDSAFLIDNGKNAFLLDTGFAFSGYAIAQNVKKALGERNLDFIFLTHSHYDHVLATPYVLKEYPNAAVVAGEYTKTIFEKPSALSRMTDLDRKAAQSFGISDYEDLSPLLRVDITVADGDIIKVGDMNIRAVFLPGHTKCSFGFYVECEKLLLSSETLGVYDGDKNIIPSFLVGYKTTLESIEKAKALDIEKLLIPHFGILDAERTSYYLDSAKKSAVDTCRTVASILECGGTKEAAFEAVRERFYHGDVVKSYPIDAFTLNTNIMIDLINKEMLDG